MQKILNIKVLNVVSDIYGVSFFHFATGEVSILKIVYILLLLLLFVGNFYINMIQNYLSGHERFDIKVSAAWMMLGLQMASPIMQIIIGLSVLKVTQSGILKFLEVNSTLLKLGYRLDFTDVRSTLKALVLGVVVLCFIAIIDISSVLYKYEYPTSLRVLRIHLAYILCTSFDALNQIHQVRILGYMEQLAYLLNLTIQEQLIKCEKDIKIEKLKLAKQLLSSLVYIAHRFNLRYSFYLLYVCFKTTATIAPFASNTMVMHCGVISAGRHTDHLEHMGENVYVATLWMMYQFVYIWLMITVYDSLTGKVNGIATTIHDLITTEKVDDIADQLLDFSVEILHTDFHFNACGFFKIDFTLIFMVISSICSYTVYLIQFQVTSSTLSSLEARNTNITAN